MQTIIIKLDSRKMINPDLDIRYTLPDRLEKITSGRISDNGYDYISKYELGIWLETDSAEHMFPVVADLIKNDNNLKSSEIYISDSETAEIHECRKVY